MRGGELPRAEADLQALVRSLKEAFGDRAIDIAVRQCELADDASASTWARIVETLRS